MVKYQKYNLCCNHWKKSKDFHVVDDDEEAYLHSLGSICANSVYNNKKATPKLLYFIFLSLLSCGLILAPQILSSNSTFSFFYPFAVYNDGLGSEADVNGFLCSSLANGTICCDRNSIRTDICIMKGDIRTHSASSSIFLYKKSGLNDFVSDPSEDEKDELEAIQQEKIRPYTRKWETSVMDTIDELNLYVNGKDSGIHQRCDVQHDVPAVFFSTGGYTGNLYHEFNDGILPLYITSQHLNKKVVFVILEYHNWWIMKYGDILSQLSDFPAIDFSGDKRVHCFPEAIVGLRIHDELTVNSSLIEGNKTIRDFRDLLDQAYWPRIRGLMREEAEAQLDMEKSALSPSSSNLIQTMKEKQESTRPKLVIISRNGSRAITNEDLLVKMAEDIGFMVEVVKPQRTSELAKTYRFLNSSDVMIGVHGAAMTHFLFMKPGSVFVQVIPLGTDWAAETYYGQPAVKLGLKYIGYKILPKESSLYDDYDKNDPVLNDPLSVNDKGWEFTKKIYLDRQNVRLNLARFRKRLLRVYYYCIAQKNKRPNHLSQ